MMIVIMLLIIIDKYEGVNAADRIIVNDNDNTNGANNNY